ncbi:MAG TPA: hypothetical protein VK567_19560, partial [Bradyrhizobium sp.]|nr:hypothetical protein [Bradyrhizobium sp.]
MIRKSMPSGHDPMGGYRFSEKIMLKQKIGRHDDSKKSHAALRSLFPDHREMDDGLHGLFHIPGGRPIPDERRLAIATPPNRLMTQRCLCRTRLVVMRMDAVTMRLSDLQLTPARVGLILLMLLLLGAIVFRVITASEHREVRPSTTPENSERVAPN